MRFFEWLFGVKTQKKETIKLKRVFVSFAIEDEQYRDYLIKQAKKEHSPFSFIDMSVKRAWEESEWKKKVQHKN